MIARTPAGHASSFATIPLLDLPVAYHHYG
jgi:hypothetical protein